MTVFEKVIAFILLSGIILMLYIAIKNYKEFLNFMYHSWRLSVVTFPIWFPFWVYDKLFKAGIFEDRSASKRDDIEYESEKTLTLHEQNYSHYLIVKTSIDDAIKVLKDNSVFLPQDISIKLSYKESIDELILQLPDSVIFENFLTLVQCFRNDLDENRVVSGYGYNKHDDNVSYFLMQDPSPLHINTLIGTLKSGEKIFVYIVDDFEKSKFLSFNSNLVIPVSFDFDKYERLIKNLPLNVTIPAFLTVNSN